MVSKTSGKVKVLRKSLTGQIGTRDFASRVSVPDACRLKNNLSEEAVLFPIAHVQKCISVPRPFFLNPAGS